MCFMCEERLATVTFECPSQHRMTCRRCYEVFRSNAAPRIPRCPICRQPVARVSDSTHLMLREISLDDGMALATLLEADYPFGSRLFGQAQIADADVVRVVREAMEAVNATRLNLRDLQIALANRLTRAQEQLVFVELIRFQDLHRVMLAVNGREYERGKVLRQIQEMVVHTIDSSDNRAILSRAVVGTIGDTIFSATQSGLSGLSTFNAGADGVTNGIMFAVFSAIEVYRYSKGEIDGVTASVNIGEHAVGAAAGFGGGYAGCLAGAAVGALIGSVVPVVGTAVGGVIGSIIGMFLGGMICDATGRWLYRKVLPKTETRAETNSIEVEERLTPKEVAQNAANRFNVHLHIHSFAEANTRFRETLLANHPDKFPHENDVQKAERTAATRDIIACWVIVRTWYNDNGQVATSTTLESYVTISVLKMWDAAKQQWNVTRTWWIGEMVRLERALNPALERLDEVTIYL